MRGKRGRGGARDALSWQTDARPFAQPPPASLPRPASRLARLRPTPTSPKTNSQILPHFPPRFHTFLERWRSHDQLLDQLAADVLRVVPGPNLRCVARVLPLKTKGCAGRGEKAGARRPGRRRRRRRESSTHTHKGAGCDHHNVLSYINVNRDSRRGAKPAKSKGSACPLSFGGLLAVAPPF